MNAALYLDWTKGRDWLDNKIQSLTPLSGTCIFIDLCSSTGIKQKGRQQWILYLGNAFILQHSPLLKSHRVKIIGDEIMVFVPDEDLDADGHVALFDEVTLAVSRWQNEIDEMTLRSKAAIHHCDDVCGITFHEQVKYDYYGIGIDLTARLMKHAVENRIICSDSFYRKICTDNECALKMKGRYIGNFKGIPGDVQYWIHDVP
jgi:class 3 adenylate cyclase